MTRTLLRPTLFLFLAGSSTGGLGLGAGTVRAADLPDSSLTPGEYMLRTQRAVAREIVKRYRAKRERGNEACLFRRVRVKEGPDQWKVIRQNLKFKWADEELEPFEVRFTLDPETFEFFKHGGHIAAWEK